MDAETHHVGRWRRPGPTCNRPRHKPDGREGEPATDPEEQHNQSVDNDEPNDREDEIYRPAA